LPRARNRLHQQPRRTRQLPWFDNHKRLRELVAELEEISLAIAEKDPRWNR
jgi:coenzyme F420-reducing hydrogenase alpha subunit